MGILNHLFANKKTSAGTVMILGILGVVLRVDRQAVSLIKNPMVLIGLLLAICRQFQHGNIKAEEHNHSPDHGQIIPDALLNDKTAELERFN